MRQSTYPPAQQKFTTTLTTLTAALTLLTQSCAPQIPYSKEMVGARKQPTVHNGTTAQEKDLLQVWDQCLVKLQTTR